MADLSGVFFDTSAFIALAHRDDQYHGAAVSFYRHLWPRVTRISTQPIVGETYSWLRYRVGADASHRFLDEIELAVSSGYLNITYVSEAIDQAARAKLRRYRDQDISYVDATSLAILDELPDDIAVFTFDHHFVITGRMLVPGPLG